MKVKIDLNTLSFETKLKMVNKLEHKALVELILDLAEDNFSSLHCSLDLVLERFKADEIDLDLDKVG